MIRTSKLFRNISSVITLYKTLVRSQLEYAPQIWSPFLKTYNDKVEQVQRRFSRYVFKKFHIPYLPYTERLKVLELEPLSSRRKFFDLVLLYKIVNGNMKTSCVSEICIRRRRNNIRNMQIFGIRLLRHNVAFHSPIPRMMRTYNEFFGNVHIFNFTKKNYESEILKVLN